MQYKEIKVGDTLYIYDRFAVSLSTKKVTSEPTIKGEAVEIIVGNTAYTLKATSDVGYTDRLLISTNKSAIARELESQKAKLDDLLCLLLT